MTKETLRKICITFALLFTFFSFLVVPKERHRFNKNTPPTIDYTLYTNEQYAYLYYLENNPKLSTFEQLNSIATNKSVLKKGKYIKIRFDIILIHLALCYSATGLAYLTGCYFLKIKK